MTPTASGGPSPSPALPTQADERERLIAAFSKAAAEQGYSRLDIATVARYAGLPTAPFHRNFESAERALVAAQEVFLKRLWLDIESACEGVEEWPQKIAAAIAAVISSLGEASAVARVFAIEAPGASLAAAERQFSSIDQLAALLRSGRRHYPRAAALPDSTERALVGGTISIICQHLLAEDTTAIAALCPQLTELLLGPFLGAEEARLIEAGAWP